MTDTIDDTASDLTELTDVDLDHVLAYLFERHGEAATIDRQPYHDAIMRVLHEQAGRLDAWLEHHAQP